MKNIYLTLLVILWVSVTGSAQTQMMPSGDPAHLLSGEHTSLFWSGSGVINGANNVYTTSWMQIGSSLYSNSASNQNIAVFNPERFTLTLKLNCYGTGDSARVSQARFEMAYDTTAVASWMADSTNFFIKAGNAGHPLYGQGLYEALSDTARRWDYPLRVARGGFIRFIFNTSTSDSVRVYWTLWGEH